MEECKPGNAPRLLFSAMDASVATEIERAFAQAGHVVVSNSRNHRMERDVPLLVPEINPDHLKLVPGQQRARGWKGQIVTNPNCSTIVLTMALGPLKQFGITKIVATTLQAISGAGYPGVASMDIIGNVVPSSAAKKKKCSRKRRRSWAIFAATTSSRSPPRSARTAIASPWWMATPSRSRWSSPPSPPRPICATPSKLSAASRSSATFPARRRNPSSTWTKHNRPQPRKDAERERGMAAFVGRLRPCPVLDYKFVALGHNTIRGAAGAAVLNAELMHSEGMLD